MICDDFIAKVKLDIAGITLQFDDIDDGLMIDNQSSSRYFFMESNSCVALYHCSLKRCFNKDFPTGDVLFRGQPWEDMALSYQWQIEKTDQQIAIRVLFSESLLIKSALVLIDFIKMQVTYLIDTDEQLCKVDPFLNPIGVLLYLYLAHHSNGLLIHASGVVDKGRGYLFSGVSGKGKSTMAKLWSARGAHIINDDRLLIMPGDLMPEMYNTPMPFYADEPRNGQLNAIFLIHHANENYCRPITGAKALLMVSANCIQHFHTKEHIEKAFQNLTDVVMKIPVYELGFKPDDSVVEFVRNLSI